LYSGIVDASLLEDRSVAQYSAATAATTLRTLPRVLVEAAMTVFPRQCLAYLILQFQQISINVFSSLLVHLGHEYSVSSYFAFSEPPKYVKARRSP
jgi:hypothetical protein